MTTTEKYLARELPQWNWAHRIAPPAAVWKRKFAEVIAGVFRRPGAAKLRIEQAPAPPRHDPNLLEFPDAKEIWIGSGKKCDVVLSAATVDERHARISRNPGEETFTLTHFSERFGTHLNGQKITRDEPVALKPGDVLTIPAAPALTITWQTQWFPDTTADLLVERSLGESWEAFAHGAPPIHRRWTLDVGAKYPAIVETDSEALERLIRAQPGPENSQSATRSEVADAVLIRYAASLSDTLPPPVSVGGFTNLPEPSMRGLSISVGIRISSGGLRLRCFVPFPVLETLRERYPAPEPEESAITVTGNYWVVAGRQELTASEVAALEPGDYIRLERDTAALMDERAPHYYRAADTTGDAIRLRDLPPANLFYVEDSVTQPVSAGLDIDQLPVQVAVIVARKELPYSEIRRLAAGEILPLDRSWSGPVDIALNGKILGKGELVEVDGTLAVKLCGWTGA